MIQQPLQRRRISGQEYEEKDSTLRAAAVGYEPEECHLADFVRAAIWMTEWAYVREAQMM